MDVVITLEDPPEVRVTEVHPIALQDAFALAVDAALRLNRELTRVDGDTP